MKTPWAKKRSFRYWMGFAMILTIVPVLLSATAGYFMLKHGVLEPFRDVLEREREQAGALTRLQLSLRETEGPVALYVDEANPAEPAAYRHLRQQIELAFANLSDNLDDDPAIQTLVERAREDWSEADRHGTAVMAAPRPAGDPENLRHLEAFIGHISAAVDRLSAANARLQAELYQEYERAERTYERSEWIAGIAAGIALLFMVGGVFMISRLILSNVDRLVEGANRFAEGDRDYRIQIELPRELRKVADEFNRMISRIHDTETALENLARTDTLTGLLNRRTFDEQLREAAARKNRTGEPFSVCLVDLDHFKKVNDTYGHAAGDIVLRTAAQTMGSELREIDKVFRMGGEEFAVLLPGVGLEGALATAERLRTRIAARTIAAEGQEIAVTVSIGVADGTHEPDMETLLRKADEALYSAKAEGRDRVQAAS
jgi:diguanylate cyclase (GGDEF)-like protein